MVWWKAAVTPAYQQVVAREAEGNQIGYPLASDVASLRLTDSSCRPVYHHMSKPADHPALACSRLPTCSFATAV